MKIVTIFLSQIIFFCLLYSNPAAETIYGRGGIGSVATWDISEGGYGDNGDFQILPFDTYDLFPINGAGYYTLSNLAFHEVKTASADSADYHYAGYAHTIEQNIHVFRTVDGNYAKVRIDLFGYFGGEDYNIEWVYQADGSTNLDHLLGVEESTWGAIKQVFKSE